MGHDVFVSYALDDKPVADVVCARAEAKEIRCSIATVRRGSSGPSESHHRSYLNEPS
jgi:hypothetical protein